MKRVSLRKRTVAIQLFMLSGLAGCASRVDRPVSPPSAPHSPAAPLEHDGASACGPGIAGQEHLNAPIVILGETHGTTEIPAVFGRLACHAATQRHDRTVLVGLEIPSSAQSAIDAFLDSDGGSEARGAVLEPEFWHREYQDGRSSQAMLDLLDTLRRLRASGRKLLVRALDLPPGESLAERDARMAAVLVEAVESARPGQTLVLVGDVHSRLLAGYPWDPAAQYLPLGAHVRAKYGDTIGLHVTASGGSAWTCSSASAVECGSTALREREVTGETPRIALNPDTLEQTGWSGTLFIGNLSASSPARPQTDPPVPER